MRVAPVSLLAVALLTSAGCGEHQPDRTRRGPGTLAELRLQFPAVEHLLSGVLPLSRVDRWVAPRPQGPRISARRGAWRGPARHRLEVRLSGDAAGITRVSSGPVTLEIRPLGARPVMGQLEARALIFRAAYPRADSIMVAAEDRVEELILLRDASAPRAFQYEVRVTRGGGRMRQLEGHVEVLDTLGNAWLRLTPPFVLDQEGKQTAATATLEGDRLTVALPAGAMRYPALLDPAWTTTGSSISWHAQHTATVLKSGKVLMVGGFHGPSPATNELYDLATGTWTATSSNVQGRSSHVAALLPSGKVLVAGGYKRSTAELYDPIAGTWALTGSMSSSRYKHAASRLKSGAVLVTGGVNKIKTAEIYHPGSGKWTLAQSMNAGRHYHTSTLLASGKVLVTGAFDRHEAAEVFDPKSGFWSSAGYMSAVRKDHTATLLPSTKVLVVGGGPASSELYDPASGKWTAAGSTKAGRSGHAAALLFTGRVLITGGGSTSAALKTAEIWDPTAASWALAQEMKVGRFRHQLTRLPSGWILAAGGFQAGATVELFDGTTGLACANAAACLSGFCTDGVCCGSACTGTCKECRVEGGVGSCLPVAAGKTDTNAATACAGDSACDGKGGCKLLSGEACKLAADCLSGFCADGVCCEAACDGTCKTCQLSGGVGKCVNVTLGQADAAALSPCQGSNVCDGQGACKTAMGQPCSNSADCASGVCGVDAVCCDSQCSATCRSCLVPGKAGTCSLVPAGKTDPAATVPCAGTLACDGKGSCQLGPGQACSGGAMCATGLCVDGVCCLTDCKGTCMSCAVSGSAGTCSNVPAGLPDASASIPCTGSSKCDGKGACTLAAGQPCKAGGECTSGHCVDGVCCASACTGTCKSCSVAGSPGVCANVPQNKPDTSASIPCGGTKTCDGAGACKAAAGQPCAGGAACGGSHCVDGVCCDTACDKACMSCAVSGSLGSCSFNLAQTAAKTDCPGKHPKCSGLCDGAGQCGYPSMSTSCGACQACDGSGGCTLTPLDDQACGIIDCDKLDTACRDYRDLTADRCDALGQCKAANSNSSCTSYTDLSCDAGAADATPARDLGAGADTSPAADRGAGADLKIQGDQPEAGCNCQAGRSPGPGGGALLLLLAACLGRAARRRAVHGPAR